MVVSIALWSLELQPGSPQTFIVPNDLRITNVALGAEVVEEKGRTSVKLTYSAPTSSDSDDEDEDEEKDEDDEKDEDGSDEEAEAPTTTVLCSLTPGKIEQALVDIILEELQEVVFEAVGKNTVYLTGNYVDQTPIDHDHGDEDEDDYSDSDLEDPYGLDGASSDIDIDEIDADEDDSHRFEEVAEEVKSDSKKRPRESDVMDIDEQKLSKAEKKKLNKKLKAENGEAVPAGTTEKVEEKAEKPKEQKKDKKEKKEKPKKDAGAEEKGKKTEARELAGGLVVEDHKVGSGAQAKNGDMVSMRYVGKLTNGKQFDANTKGKPFKFRLGKGEVIKGWDVGVAGMQVGGERKLTVPAAMAYGKRAQAGIPGNSTLVFEVKLLSIN